MVDGSAFEEDAPGLRVNPSQTLLHLLPPNHRSFRHWEEVTVTGLPSEPGPACKMLEKPQDVAKEHAATLEPEELQQLQRVKKLTD